MLCVPAVSSVVVKVATPLPFNVALPSAVVPSRTLTVPVGVPAVPGVNVAVNVKAPTPELAFSAVVVFAFCTTWLNAAEELALKLASPL